MLVAPPPAIHFKPSADLFDSLTGLRGEAARIARQEAPSAEQAQALRRRSIRPPRTRAVCSPSSSFGPSPPLRRRIALGRQARPDRVMPGRSRSRNRSPRGGSHSKPPPAPRRPLRHPLHQPHLLHQLPRRGRRPHRRHRRLRSALGPGRAGVRATGTTSIPGHPATRGPGEGKARARTGSTTTTPWERQSPGQRESPRATTTTRANDQSAETAPGGAATRGVARGRPPRRRPWQPRLAGV